MSELSFSLSETLRESPIMSNTEAAKQLWQRRRTCDIGKTSSSFYSHPSSASRMVRRHSQLRACLQRHRATGRIQVRNNRKIGNRAQNRKNIRSGSGSCSWWSESATVVSRIIRKLELTWAAVGDNRIGVLSVPLLPDGRKRKWRPHLPSCRARRIC